MVEDPLKNNLSEDFKESKILGDFKIIRLLGKGGMAHVYEAEQLSLKRAVALKVLPTHLGFHDESIKRFQREAEAGSRQSHSGIVAIYAVGEHEGYHYIAQELVEGETSLADRLEENRKQDNLPIGYYRQSAKMVVAIADALRHAHDSGVIHRDIKPSNILITPDGQPKISDFGLAKIENALDLSRAGEFLGTPFYMSPEQAMTNFVGIDHRTDIYSLGVTLYEILTLQRPFEGKTSQEVLKKIMFLEPKNPCRLNAQAPRDLAAICLKAMEKDAKDRYQTAAEFKDDLDRYLLGEVVKAKPAGLGVRTWKWIKRHPAGATVAGVLVLAVLSVILNWCWSLGEIVKERNKAQATSQFLERMLLSPDPDRDGRQVKVVEILDQAVQELKGAFPEQPEVEASLRNVLGSTYEALGIYDEAEVQQRISLEMRSRVLDEEDEATLVSMNDLATVLLHQGRYKEAEPLLRSVARGMRNRLGETDSETLTVLNNLAGALQGLGKHQEAETLYREILQKRIQVQGQNDPYTLRAKNNLAVMLMRRGEYAEAEKLFKEVVRTGEAEPEHDYTITLKSKNNLACLFRDFERYDEAESLYRELLEVQTVKFGEEHSNVLITLYNLAETLVRQKKISQAEPLSRRALEGRCKVFGRESIITLESMNQLGRILLLMKKLPEAEALLRDGVEIAQKILPANHPDRTAFHAMYARCLVLLRKYGQAESHMLACYAGMKERAVPDRDLEITALKNLVAFYEEWGEQERAEEYKTILTALEENRED